MVKIVESYAAGIIVSVFAHATGSARTSIACQLDEVFGGSHWFYAITFQFY